MKDGAAEVRPHDGKTSRHLPVAVNLNWRRSSEHLIISLKQRSAEASAGATCCFLFLLSAAHYLLTLSQGGGCTGGERTSVGGLTSLNVSLQKNISG